MAEDESIPPLSDQDGTDTSQSKDAFIPEESIQDVSLLDIQMPETPESTKGQVSDGDTSRVESPKMVKPVLGKVQAKKRLMAFANKFKVLLKPQVKSNLSQHSTGALKTKDKAAQDDTSMNKSRKKTEEKILAIEEIRREESKSKLLLAEAMAAANMDDEHHGKNISGLLENTKRVKDRSKRSAGATDSHKSRSATERKYSERHRHRDKTDRDNHTNQESKDKTGSTERSARKSQDKEKHKKDKKRKDDRDKRDRAESSRDKRDEGKDRKEVEKERKDETREKRDSSKSKKDSVKDKRNDTLDVEAEGKDKKDKDKDKDRWREKELLKCNSWAELRKAGLTLDNVTQFRKRDNSERMKNRTAQDYGRHFEQMLMLNNYHMKRQPVIAEGLDGPRKYPPESIRTTKRAKGAQIQYCENPHVSLLLRIPQLLELVTPERRERIRDICEASSSRFDGDTEDTVQQKRNWYQIDSLKFTRKDTKWQVSVQLPKSKWDSEDEEASSNSVIKEEIEKTVNKLHASLSQQERCSTSSSVTDEDKIGSNVEEIKEDCKPGEKVIDNATTNEIPASPLLQSAGSEKLASEYEQFMKMVCTDTIPLPGTTDVTKEYSPKKNAAKKASPNTYHEFNIESNLAEDNANIEIMLQKCDKTEKLQSLKGAKKTEEDSTPSTDSPVEITENNMQAKHANNNDASEDTKSIPSDWENVRIKVERLSDENTESREVKKRKKKKQRKKITSSSDSSSSSSSSDSEREKKKKKRKKILSNSSSSDSDSTDSSSSSSSSDSSSTDEKRKRKRKKKKVGKKRKKARRAARTKKKRRRKTSSDSSSSDSDERRKKKRKIKKKKDAKQFDIKSVNNGDIDALATGSPVISSPSDETQILHSTTPIKKVKEEAMAEDKTRSDQIASRRSIADMNVHDTECRKQRGGRKESKSDESFMEEWEMDSVMSNQQNGGDTSSQDHTELIKIDALEKDKHRRKRKHSRDNNEQDKDGSSKANEEKIHRGKEGSDESEVETKKKKRKDTRSSTEFLADWEKESERITQQIIQNEVKLSKRTTGKKKKDTWGETDFDTLNVPSLTQLEKEVSQKQLLADEWEVDSLEAISDLSSIKRKSQSTSKKIGKEVRYDKKTDTYIAIETERAREMKKKQERLCAIRIWEEEREEGEREEMLLLQEKKKRKKDDWDIEEESFLRKSNEELGAHKVNNIVGEEKDWSKLSEDTVAKEVSSTLAKLEAPSASKRIKKSRWDMGSQSEEKPDTKDIWDDEYAEWSKINKCEQKVGQTEKTAEVHAGEYAEGSAASDLVEFHHKKSQNRESLERSWTSEELASKSAQGKQTEDVSVKSSTSTEMEKEQAVSVKKEFQSKDQFKDILGLDTKFKEKTVELYSPSSPALSQKSQDVETSNDSNSSNSLPCEKRRKETPITAEELSIPTDGIPLQLMNLRDSKHATNDKIETILDKVQLADETSVHKFDLKTTDSLFDDLSATESCSEKDSSKLIHMDIFAEYGSDESRGKRASTSRNDSEAHAKEDDGKTALKLIPKQLLIRRTNEQAKPKRVLEAPLPNPDEHAATLLSIQKKLLESHALKDDMKTQSSEAPMDQLQSSYNAPSNRETDKLLDTTEFTVAPKSIIAEGDSRSPASEKVASVQSERSESYSKENRSDDVKRYKSTRSPVKERRRSPSRRESEKRYSHDYGKDKKGQDRRSDDADKSDRRDSRGSKMDLPDSRRKSSPSGRGRKRRSRSPYASWERQRSGSKSPAKGHSWSRSHSRSPKRKDEATRNREKKREKYDDERSGRSRTDERREKYARSPHFSYSEDNFKKHGSVSSKGSRDDWGRRRHDSVERDREQDIRSYDSIDMLRDRTESEVYRDNRFHAEGEADRAFWQYEDNNILRDGNESIDSYTVGHDVPVEYDDRAYSGEGSLERLQGSPHSSTSRYRRSTSQKSGTRRERQWEKDKDALDLDRHGHLAHRSRNRTPPRSRHSPTRQEERFRRKSRSRSRSWSRSSSRSRSTSRSRLRMRSRSRSRSNSRSPSNRRSRARSTSLPRLRSPERGLRLLELRNSSRSPSPGRGRLNEMERERKDENESRKLDVCGERGRRIETIVQSGGTSILDSEMGINNSADAASFQYSSEIEGGNEYYYTENNLTYPPCIDDSTTSSPKRLSLDDRLEIELGIKKQHSKESTSTEYSSTFNPNVVVYPSPPPQQHQMMYRQQPTVLQVGNVLQVVPADFNGVQAATRREVAATPPARPAASQVVRVGNVLQVVPTSLDWNAEQSSSSAEQSNRVLYPSSTVPASSPVPPAAMSVVPVPVPVPLPVPPANVTSNLATVATMSPNVAPLPLSMPVPVPVPVPIPATAPTFPRNEVQQKMAQPVYNYEAILELRRKEREERKRLRELRKKERERKRIERTNRRALERLMEKNNMLARQAGTSLDHHKASAVDPSVLKALREGEEQGETESPSTNPVKEEEELTVPVKEEDEDAAADEDEDEDDDEAEVEAEAEAEAEDDEEEEEEAEDEDEDDDDDDEKPPRVISERTDVETFEEATAADASKNSADVEIKKEWPELPPPPLKGILIAPGFRRDAISNGDMDDPSDADDDTVGSDKDAEDTDKTNECDRDAEPDAKPSKSKLARLLNKTRKSKKSVQFADGIKPGEGTSPSGGEGDMPSPPPPTGISFREGLKDLRRDKTYSSRKSRKQEKRARPPKAKKKVKVKIIKLKKPRVAPICMDDSDETDDRSPPPPPPGSPPPPHLWPSYLSIYNTAIRTVEQPHTATSTGLTPVQAPPPPTPLPLLIPPPPLNYTIQPCSKA